VVDAAQVVALLVALTSTAAAQDFRVEASCRDGYVHGSYELRDGNGVVRAVGAFNRGKRMGSFLFWNGDGVREAHLPFDEDVLNGTVALWWPARRGEPKPRVEAAFVRGKRQGTTRSFFANGSPQTELVYGDGELRSATALSEGGKPMPEAQARAIGAREASEDDARIAAYLALVDAHLPRCDPASDRLEKS
jgi:antitoxin component YwqK of YwqJK toxin-antitoxin module